jgi:hypothetical protein
MRRGGAWVSACSLRRAWCVRPLSSREHGAAPPRAGASYVTLETSLRGAGEETGEDTGVGWGGGSSGRERVGVGRGGAVITRGLEWLTYQTML